MRKTIILSLLFTGFIVILLGSCSRETGVPGGQAATRSVGAGESLEREPVEIVVDGTPRPPLRWLDLKGLREDRFNTGREDVQIGYPLADVLAFLGVESAGSVTLHGVGLKPITLNGEEIRDRKNQIIMGLTHKGTVKVVAGNPSILNRDGWIRHLVKMEIHERAASDGRVLERDEKSERAIRKKGGSP